LDDRFENLAKGVASGKVSRRQALKRIGAGAGGALLALMTGGQALAARRQCPPGRSVPCGELCCPNGTNCCVTAEGARACCPTGQLVNICGSVNLAEIVKLGCVTAL
jgi:hypothetical protein